MNWQTVLWAAAAGVALSGCGPTRLTVKPEIPPLLMTPMPLAMGVRIPKSFAQYVEKEKSQEREWEINLGPGQADAVRTVMGAMFEHIVVLSDQAPGDAAAIAGHKLDGILETTLDSYVYLLPSPAGADYYSATIGYKVNLLSVEGKVIGSWIYEGYGSAPSRGLGNTEGVEVVTALAVRDACANLAAHLPDQELVRNLVTPAAATPAPASVPASSSDAAAPAEAKPGTDQTPSADTQPSTEPKPTIEAKPSGEATQSGEAKPSTELTPGSEAKPATEATQSSEAKPTTEAKPGDAPAPSPTPSAPESTPKPMAVEVPPATGN